MKQKILVVDDEKDICDILQFNLENEGYAVDIACSGEEALAKAADTHSLIILDVMMGGISGFTVAERLREAENYVPILFLTAKSTENDILKGFSAGGDDYMAKPFSVKELLARVKAVLKRSSLAKPPIESKWTYKNLVIDLVSRKVLIAGNEVSLTKKEFDILLLMVQTFPRTLSRADILDRVWSDNVIVLDRTVDVHVTRMRKKLGEYGSIVVNRSGFGYYLNLEEKE